ncbi:MAG: osmotically inducible protein C [Bacteroidetes bacterium HGW-Bacteroidetes-21]|nr:MAG: osmotically inducible protein C [Bacteroidetes bacterium HGW-Bacteroidetes-21]
MEHEINLNWLENMSFEGDLGNGHKMIIDAGPESGGENKGPRPKPLLLMALAGCTGMDVVSLLKKMRVEYESFTIKVKGKLTEEHPKYYESMHITYAIKGKSIDHEKVEKAVSMSKERYCGVSALFQKAIPLTYDILITE